MSVRSELLPLGKTLYLFTGESVKEARHLWVCLGLLCRMTRIQYLDMSDSDVTCDVRWHRMITHRRIDWYFFPCHSSAIILETLVRQGVTGRCRKTSRISINFHLMFSAFLFAALNNTAVGPFSVLFPLAAQVWCLGVRALGWSAGAAGESRAASPGPDPAGASSPRPEGPTPPREGGRAGLGRRRDGACCHGLLPGSRRHG